MAMQLEEMLASVHNLSLNELLRLQETVTQEMRYKVTLQESGTAVEPVSSHRDAQGRLDWQMASAEEIIAEMHASRVERDTNS